MSRKAYYKDWYVKNRGQHQNRMLARRTLAKRWAWKYKAEHPCMDCGESDPIVLDFDHRDPKEKSFNISAAVCRGSGISIGLLAVEVVKCDVRCANCHRRRTHQQRLEAQADNL